MYDLNMLGLDESQEILDYVENRWKDLEKVFQRLMAKGYASIVNDEVHYQERIIVMPSLKYQSISQDRKLSIQDIYL